MLKVTSCGRKRTSKQIGTRLGTRPPAYYDVTGIYRHIPPGHANKCSRRLFYSPCTGPAANRGITVTSWWARWRLKSPASWWFTQSFVQAQIKGKALALVRGIHRWPMNSSHKWPVTWKMFPFDGVIMGLSIDTGTHDPLQLFRYWL